MEFDILPVLPLRGLVVFPNMTVHFDVGREKSIKAVEHAMKTHQQIFLCTQKKADVSEPSTDDFYMTGTVAKISQVLKLPNNSCRVIANGLFRARVTTFENSSLFFSCQYIKLESLEYNSDSPEIIALKRNIKNDFVDYFNFNKKLAPELVNTIINSDNLDELTDIVASNLNIESDDLQEILEELDVFKRANKIVKILVREIEILEINKEINDKVKLEIDRNQREYYLREEIKVIKEELGEDNDFDSELSEYETKILELHLPEIYEEKLIKEIVRLSKLNEHSPDAAVIRTYLDSVLELPWNVYTEECYDISNAERILNKDHYGLEKVKDRILEFIAVKSIGGKINGNIICLAGPPGVGKTSIAKSLAVALNRQYVRISLGGVKDESEIRGHRKTYIGSMPGRIISAIRQAKTSNPLILLDEIDKLGVSYSGDPSAALLEVLDSEQNFEFKDNYIEIPYDLSKVMFITTANDISNIPDPLRDRMDIIELNGYLETEKIKIALHHLIPKEIEKHNLKNFVIEESAVKKIIENYTREAGVRNLDRVIASLCRKAAKIFAEKSQKSAKISENNIEKYLGVPLFQQEYNDNNDKIGVATGLAWTSCGGDVLSIEACTMEGNGKVELTGNLGEIMKESAYAAVAYIRSNCKRLNVPTDFYKKTDIHLHFPEGAVPKDGPSAGITITTAIVSALTGRKIKSNIAMTGEVTITGRVLPIGGLREKTTAARNYGIKTVIIPAKNKKDITEISDEVKESINIIYVSNVDEVLNIALEQEVQLDYTYMHTELFDDTKIAHRANN